MSTASSRSSIPSTRRTTRWLTTDGDDDETEADAEAADGDRVSDRLVRRALRPHRRHPLLPLPQGPCRHELDADARVCEPHRVPRAGDHRRDPRDVLPTDAGERV